MYERTCKGCGNEFVTARYAQKRCRKDCARTHDARTEKRLHNDIRFVGVDGEGVDRPDGTHEYVMLSVGNETLFDEGRALTLPAILGFLWDQFTANSDAAFVGFFLGYDFIQWCKMLPEREARLLFTSVGESERKSGNPGRVNPYPDAVVWQGWEFDILAGRRFRLRKHVHRKSDFYPQCRNRTCLAPMGHETNAGTAVSLGEGSFPNLFAPSRATYVKKVKPTSDEAQHPWMYICDTGPFWQTSFLNVIDPSGWDSPVCSPEEFATVVKGKADRGTVADYGTTSYAEEMRQYNVLENDILARVTTRLNQGFMNDHIPIKIQPKDWYGPGRAAQLWMDQLSERLSDPVAVQQNRDALRNRTGLRVNEGGLKNADVYLSMPHFAYSAAKQSYYGGWFEQFMHGHVGEVWEYDINSAYPAVIATLPCLHPAGVGNHNGEWTTGQGEPNEYREGNYYLLNVEVWGSNPYIGAMPFRTKKGHILRPHHLKGWYFYDELQTARDAGLIDRWDVVEYVRYNPCECGQPFAPDDIGIERMYNLRLEVGKNSPQGKGFKLVYNSTYGKTAQSKGQPKYGNPFYASLITSGCRTQILRAIATHPSGAAAVSMVATDGVYFTEPHPSLTLSPTVLGAWDVTEKHNLTQLMPGVYWDDKARHAVANGGSPKLKSRGVNARDLASQLDRLDTAFSEQSDALNGGGSYEWPGITFNIAFTLDSCKSALQRNKWNTAGRVTHGNERRISADPRIKRDPAPYLDNGIVRTRPYPIGDKLETTSYEESFGYMEVNPVDMLFSDFVNRDGMNPLYDWQALLSGELT